MSAIGPKRTCLVALHMSAFGGKADMNIRACPLLWSLLGVKRTCPEMRTDPGSDITAHVFPVSMGRDLTRGRPTFQQFNDPIELVHLNRG
jgi:hypothetical protein